MSIPSCRRSPLRGAPHVSSKSIEDTSSTGTGSFGGVFVLSSDISVPTLNKAG